MNNYLNLFSNNCNNYMDAKNSNLIVILKYLFKIVWKVKILYLFCLFYFLFIYFN